MNNYFEFIRAGINTTFQDNGRNNLYHIGIPFSGAMDKRNYILANSLVGNKIDMPVIEFAYQGPQIKYRGDKINFVITGPTFFISLLLRVKPPSKRMILIANETK